MIKIFISYSWDNTIHEEWVKKFADDLEGYKEFHIILDQYDLDNTVDKNLFMEKAVFESNIILIICTKNYALKANSRLGGVGIETYLSTSKHWDEILTMGKSNIIAILKDEREVSIPNYLKGKFDISFKNDNNYNINLNNLIQEIKRITNKTSTRPIKSKSIKNKSINYFQFDRVDDILAINYKKRKQIKIQTDFSGKNKIKYEFWKITNFDKHSYILVLFNNINIKDTIERFINDNTNLPPHLIILRANQGEKDYIKKVFLNKQINIDVQEYTLEQFVWDECLDQEWKNENKVIEEEFFIDQRVYKIIENKQHTINLSLDYIKNTFLLNSYEKSILMLFASGGMGKSTLSQVLTNKINESKDKKTLLIQPETIRNNIKKDAIKNFEIKNLYQLYDIYSKMISNNKSLLTQKQFELGILTGKIVVIIDGLDEIVSLFHANFKLREFINSLTELNLQLGKTKIIITSRINILQNNGYLKNNIDIDIIYLKGFEEDIWKNYIKKRFSSFQNMNQYIKKIEKYLSSLLTNSNEKEKIILPFFLDLISEIVEEEINDDTNNFIINSVGNDYCSNNENIDYLIHAILKREIKRQQFNVNITKFVNFFKELSATYGDKFSFEELEYFIRYYFDSNDTNDIYQKILLNPLLNIDKNSKIASFKYDFLGNYFNVLYLLEYLQHDKIKRLDQLAIKHLSKLYDGNSVILTEIIKYFTNNISNCMTSSKQIIKLISDEIKKDEQNYTQFKNTISSLLYLTQGIHGQNLSKDKRINIIKELYNDSEIKYLYIWGNFYQLDFSNLNIWFSEFHEYHLFCKSKFDNTKFYHSLFSNITVNKKCTITKDNFEMNTCTIGSLQNYLDTSEDNKNKKLETIEEDFLLFSRNFFNGINFQAKLDENLTIPIKLKSMKKNFIDFLISINFLKKDPKLLKNYYEIDKSYHRCIKNFIASNHTSPSLQKVFIKIMNIHPCD